MAKEDLEKVKDELLKTRNEIQSLNRDKDVLNEKMQQTELKGEKQMAYPEKLTEVSAHVCCTLHKHIECIYLFSDAAREL